MQYIQKHSKKSNQIRLDIFKVLLAENHPVFYSDYMLKC